MSAKAVDALAKGPIGELTPVLTLDEATASYTLLDTFDQSLRLSGRVLLESAGLLDLLLADGRVLSQPAKRKGNFIPDLQEGPVKTALSDLSSLRSLLPIGSGTSRRGGLALLDEEQKTHCRASVLTLTGAERKGTAILTLHGLRGYDASLAALRKHIEACGGTALHQGRDLAAVAPEQDAYEAKPTVVIASDDSVFDAATAIVSAYIPVARANEAGIIADHDTEFLHDYRVALRKIRSVLSLFKGVYGRHQTPDLKARFSALMAPTGRLRDLDVYMLQRQDFYGHLPKSLHGGLDRLYGMFAEERARELAALKRHLKSKRYNDEIAALARLFHRRKKLQSGPSAELEAYPYASDLIWRRYRKICKLAGEMGPETDDAEVHALRIHCKKLRYLMELFRPLYPKAEFKALLGPLKQLQDVLGLFNDYAVQQVSLQAFLSEGRDRPDDVTVEIAQSVGALTAVLHRQQAHERAKLAERFAQFRSLPTQAAFRDLFHQRKDKK